MILTACGATVKTLADAQRNNGCLDVDCCLFASTTLPPHVVSMPIHVSKLMQCIRDDVPLLDLAWAHQSIIQRKRLPLFGDSRFAVSLDTRGLSSTYSVSSFKSEGDGKRYEVGDLVQFSRGSKSSAPSRGRIVGITVERLGNGCKLNIQLLDPGKDFELVDCRSSATLYDVDASSLQGNVLMFSICDKSGKPNWASFHKLGYVPKSASQTNIFNRYVPSNDSQM